MATVKVNLGTPNILNRHQMLPAAGTVFAYQQSRTKENTYELFIYDEITKYGSFNWETWEYNDSETSANKFREILRNIPEGSELDIHINSNGGEAYEAVAIYNLLCQYQGHKTSYVDGAAHSAAFIIPFACDKRIMGLGTASLFHNMWIFAQGSASQLRAAADRLDQLMESNRKIYMQRAKNITEKEMTVLMDNETILTPEMCLEYGFCDEIGGYVPDTERQMQNTSQRADQLKQIAAVNETYRQQLINLSQYADKLAMQKGPETESEQQEPEQEEQGPGPEQMEQNSETQKMALNFMSAFLTVTTQKQQ